MDILPYLKSHHDAIRSSCQLLADADGGREQRVHLDALARGLQVYLVLERDYLFPEVAGLFAGAEGLVAVAQVNAAMIDKKLKALVKTAAKGAVEGADFRLRLSELHSALAAHFDQEEQILMPKMRSLIRTEDREDLGQVFADAEAEVLASATDEHAARERALSGRKRA